MRLALIIPTCGRPYDLAACLWSIEAAAVPELVEVIVIDDSPRGSSVAPVRIPGAEVRVSRNRRPIGAAASRNRAISMLDPSIDAVGFLDDDIRLPPDWFAVVLAELLPERGAITGPVQRFDLGLVARARQLRYDARYQPLAAGQPVDFLAGGNAVIWVEALHRAGDFPAAAIMSDTLLARRLEQLGTPCHFIPGLRVLHRNSKGVRQACVAAWQAGQIEGRRRPTTYGRRLVQGASGVATSADPLAAGLNVALDAVFLGAHASSRTLWISRRAVRGPIRIERPPVAAPRRAAARK
jgi:GT2 family glycosyltransferase